MNSQFAPTIRHIIGGAWRRRYLMVLPFLIVFPLALLWGLYGPRSYVSKSLMLLQETASSNPLARDGASPANRIQERMAGLQALLKSERVLGNVYRDINREPPSSPKELAGWMRDFGTQLTVELIGTDFLEFQLKDGKPKGLGKRLEAVTSRFLEALLPEQNALYASQVLLEKRREELDSSERALALFRQRLAEQHPGGLGLSHNRLAETRTLLQSKQTQLQRIGQEITDRRTRLSAPSARVEQEIAKVRAELASLEGRGDDAQAKGVQFQGRLTELIAIRDLEVNRGTTETEVSELARQMDGLGRSVRQVQPLAEHLTQLEREAAEAKEGYDEYARRYQRATSMRTGGILNAPERIKLIDAPRDPEFPATSAVRLATMFLLGSIFLGLGLAIMAELLDPRMRSSEEAGEATGLPVLAKLS